jgi:murein DD-endopeptidase MepM/ murein hydrolase activator NlpD
VRSPKHAFLLLVPLLLIGAGTRPTEPDRNQPEPPPPAPAVMTVYDWMTVLPAPATSPAFQPPPGQRVSWPLLGVITQPFGCTGFVLEKGTTACPSGFHTGIDIARPQGTAIAAAGPGLAYPFTDDQRYGNHVIIQMEGGLSTIYGHMVRMNVAWGQPVQAGDVIGWVGSTGNSTGPHVHFEVRYGGVAFDPMTYLDGSPPDPYPLPEGWPGAPPDDSIGRR